MHRNWNFTHAVLLHASLNQLIQLDDDAQAAEGEGEGGEGEGDEQHGEGEGTGREEGTRNDEAGN